MSKYKTILQSNKDELHSMKLQTKTKFAHPPFGLMNDPNGVS